MRATEGYLFSYVTHSIVLSITYLCASGTTADGLNESNDSIFICSNFILSCNWNDQQPLSGNKIGKLESNVGGRYFTWYPNTCNFYRPDSKVAAQ